MSNFSEKENISHTQSIFSEKLQTLHLLRFWARRCHRFAPHLWVCRKFCWKFRKWEFMGISGTFQSLETKFRLMGMSGNGNFRKFPEISNPLNPFPWKCTAIDVRIGLELIPILTSIAISLYRGLGPVYRVIYTTYRAQTSTIVGNDTSSIGITFTHP